MLDVYHHRCHRLLTLPPSISLRASAPRSFAHNTLNTPCLRIRCPPLTSLRAQASASITVSRCFDWDAYTLGGTLYAVVKGILSPDDFPDISDLATQTCLPFGIDTVSPSASDGAWVTTWDAAEELR
ncbi:hypothetical protein D9619_007589 [Psilocybe cf. subviscida]|uniref:Uncharacterized protein n=1 Tax=Psilocybe cf. subviscida TaxID=2480587 RepID=A0A8H5B2L3_9AGAR|nr:hypothetical protein D9619_007589 [Psilocybe cf. subviscida]